MPPDLAGPIAPVAPVVAALDPRLASVSLTAQELDDLVAFVRESLLDARATPERLRGNVPARVPSGSPTLRFQFARAGR